MGKQGAPSVACNKCGYFASTTKDKNNLKDKNCPHCKKGTMKEIR